MERLDPTKYILIVFAVRVLVLKNLEDVQFILDTLIKTKFGLAVIVINFLNLLEGKDEPPCSTMDHKYASYPAEEAKIYFFNPPITVN